jgi:hypothetical protein
MTEKRRSGDDPKYLTIKKAATVIVPILLVIIGFFVTLLITDLKAATEKKLDKEVYNADKAAQYITNQRLEGKLDDLIDLHIKPDETRRKILRERKGG